MSDRHRGRAICVVSLLFAGIWTGCFESRGQVERENEARAEVAREHAAERRAARRRAAEIESALRAGLRPVSGARPNCRFSAADVLPRAGIAVVGCADLGRRWPLSVPWAYLRCERAEDDRRLVLSTPEGVDYALDVNARLIGYPRIDPLLNGRAAEAPTEAVAPLVARAAPLCG